MPADLEDAVAAILPCTCGPVKPRGAHWNQCPAAACPAVERLVREREKAAREAAFDAGVEAADLRTFSSGDARDADIRLAVKRYLTAVHGEGDADAE